VSKHCDVLIVIWEGVHKDTFAHNESGIAYQDKSRQSETKGKPTVG
jgi:hypothetical protein